LVEDLAAQLRLVVGGGVDVLLLRGLDELVGLAGLDAALQRFLGFLAEGVLLLVAPEPILDAHALSSLFAEELDELGGGRATLPGSYEAVASQHRPLAAQDDLAVPVDGKIRTVGAAVGEHELVLAPFDLAVPARSHAIGNHEVRRVVAAHDD